MTCWVMIMIDNTSKLFLTSNLTPTYNCTTTTTTLLQQLVVLLQQPHVAALLLARKC